MTNKTIKIISSDCQYHISLMENLVVLHSIKKEIKEITNENYIKIWNLMKKKIQKIPKFWNLKTNK